VKCRYDGSVRDAQGNLVEFLYGEDGMEGSQIEDQKIKLVGMKHVDVIKNFKHDYHDPKYGEGWIQDVQARREIREQVDLQEILDEELEELQRLKKVLCEEVFTDGDDGQHIPLNVDRIIEVAKAMYKNDWDQGAYSPVTIAEEVNKLLKKLQVVVGVTEDDALGKSAQENATIKRKFCRRTESARDRLIG